MSRGEGVGMTWVVGGKEGRVPEGGTKGGEQNRL